MGASAGSVIVWSDPNPKPSSWNLPNDDQRHNCALLKSSVWPLDICTVRSKQPQKVLGYDGSTDKMINKTWQP